MDGNSFAFDDQYECTTVSPSSENYDLTTDSYKQWITYNKSTIPMAMLSLGCKAFSFGVTASSALSANKHAADEIFTKASENGKMSEGDWKSWKELLGNRKSLKSSVASGVVNVASSAIPALTTQLNAWLGPNSARSVGSMFTDLLSHSLQLHSSVYVCNNIEQCAQYYHRNGYLVNEYFNSLEELSFTDLHESSIASTGDKTISYVVDMAEGYHYKGIKDFAPIFSNATVSNVVYTIVPNSFNSSVTVTITFTVITREHLASLHITFDYFVNHEINIFSHVNNRYYFNVLKMSICDVYLNCIESNDIIDNISSRLISGIRLWDMSHGDICDFRYDNVERSYL